MLAIHKRRTLDFYYKSRYVIEYVRFQSTECSDTAQLDANGAVISHLPEKLNNETTERAINPVTPVSTGVVRGSILPQYVSLKKYNDSQDLIPRLSHKLDRTLFSPGVHYLQDPRTHFTNFDASLLSIPHLNELNMDKISNFIPSSRDTKLLDISKDLNSNKTGKHSVNFFSSTSSMTGVLTKFHKFLSGNRPINTGNFSKVFPSQTTFTSTIDVPTSLVVTPKDEDATTFSIDADRSTDSEITLSVLGNALELMLTKKPKEFNKYLKSSKLEPEADKSAYHYAKIGKFLIRSQLDAFHQNLPGRGTFDIKTRAVCAIRFDLAHTDYYPTNYEIVRTHGLFESFERELFDAARIVMFKYGLQARLGNMDGIFMAFHNIKKFLGFQYLPLSEIDNIYFGDISDEFTRYGENVLVKTGSDYNKKGGINTDDKSNKAGVSNQEFLSNIVNDIGNHFQTKREALSTYVANKELRFSMKLLENLMDVILKDTGGVPFRMIFKKMKGKKAAGIESREDEIFDDSSPFNEKSSDGRMVVIVNTLTPEELTELQMLSNEKIEKSKILLKNSQDEKMSTTARIKFFSKYASEFKGKFFRLNKQILKNSRSNGGFFGYEINIQHFFNDKPSSDKYPMPSVDILEDKKYKWDIKYSVNKINEEADLVYLFNKFVSNIGYSAFRSSESDANVDVYTDDGYVQIDENASELQNITRAYSARALKRKSLKVKK